MKLARYAAFPLVALAAIFGYLTIFDRSAKPERRPTADQAGDVEALVGRINDLENQLRIHRISTRELAQQQADNQAQSQANAPPDEVPDERDSDTQEDGAKVEPREVTYKRLQDRFAHYDRSLEQEVRDPTWANEMEKNLLDMEKAMQERHLPGTKLTSMECRSTMCRAEFEHENRRERNMAPMLLHAEGLPRVSIMRKGDAPTDKQITVAYLAKSELPAYVPEGVDSE